MRCLSHLAWSLLILLSVTANSPAQLQNTFNPHHVARLRSVTEAVISPDGKQVAYVLSIPRDIPNEKDGPAWAELHVVDTEAKSIPFITGSVNIGSLAWTPDGKNIAFLTRRDKDDHRSLYIIGTRGGEARKVLSHGSDISAFSFSGDGKQVAFLAQDPVSKAAKKRKDQGFSQEIYEEDQPLTHVWLADLPEKRGDDAGEPRKLKLKGHASELHFNPKYARLAVALAPDAIIDSQLMFRKVHIVDLQTGKATNLDNPGKIGQMAWSNDGKKLALISAVDKHDPREGRLWVTSLDRPQWADVTARDQSHANSIAWSRGRLASIEDVGVNSAWNVNTIDIKDDGTCYISGRAIMDVPKGLILSDVSYAKEGVNSACIAHTAKHPPEVYFAGPGEGTPRRLTNSNPWLQNMRFAKQEVIKYRARDGLELEGVLVRPLDEKKGQRYPLVLTVHGGPEAHYANGWVTIYHSLGQVAASHGMAVFYPNYRGSTGYGVEFSMKGQADAGGREFDDLVDGVDHLIEMGLVDKYKVGITGGSYGGYATAWGATYYSKRFAAGVMFVGVSDWISCSGTTDIPHEMNLVHQRKWLWEDWDYFLKSSPIYHVKKAHTPLLILHGKSDPRVHPSQSMELYRHLKVRGKAPVRLVFYPGEGHGNRRAASRLDYNMRLLRWMRYYLQGLGRGLPPQEIEYGLSEKTSRTSWGGQATASMFPPTWTGRGCPCCIQP